MEELATYIGYAVIVLLLIITALFSLFVLYSIITTIHRIGYRHKTIFFLRKAEAKATYKAANMALKYLQKVGCVETQTLKDIKLMIENLKKRQKLKD